MRILFYFIALLAFTSCEDVIDLPLEEGPKRLVIDANINWEKGTAGNEQAIRLTETVGFYDTDIPPASGATVTVSDSNKDYIFTEDGTTGIYRTSTFEPQIGETYTLSITYKGENYSATEALKSVTDITRIEQSVENIFGTESIRVDFIYTDPVDEENYYVSVFSSDAFLLNSTRTWSDEFINGNEDSVFEIDENFEPGNTLTLRFFGVSEQYHNYTELLLQQIESGGPFATPPAAVKGNCINDTDPDNKPLGYFRLSEVVTTPYIIQ